jgi:hypothetical protein
MKAYHKVDIVITKHNSNNNLIPYIIWNWLDVNIDILTDYYFDLVEPLANNKFKFYFCFKNKNDAMCFKLTWDGYQF